MKYLYLVVALLLITTSVFLYLNFKTDKLNFETSEINFNPEVCKTLEYNGENKINLVFFSTKNQTKKYSDYLMSLSPFDKNKNEFNIYYIEEEPACEIYQEKAILCYDKSLIKKASHCPNDYIFVIKEEPSSIRSSAYMNVVSINSNHPLNVIGHEFGHALANLADEYVPAKLPKKSKNCIKNEEDFAEETEKYLGCSNENYYRSINLGIMKSLSSKNFGLFNENLILEKITKTNKLNVLTGNAILEQADCSKEYYYLIEGEMYGNEIKIISKTIEQGCIGTNGEGDFSYEIMQNSNTYSENKFNPELIFTDSHGELQISGEVLDRQGNFFLKIPTKVDEMVIKDSDENVLVTENFDQLNKKIDSRPCKE